ncbi:MAG: cyclic nucleotide-binding domain-containing protein [Bacteroidota bacterium]|nr:cyclic nucleotide-binding domain-containing protein [Bacteroidota bacterium]
MANALQKILDIDKAEEGPVYLLLANSFFIGVFLVTYDVAASTLFLDAYGQEFLTRVPIFSGILGMISTSLFIYFQRKIPFTYLALTCFAIITVIVASVFWGLESLKIKEVKFAAFILLGPINSIFLLCFYGTVSRSFSLKREKHMTNTVDQGQMVATTIAFFLIPVITGAIPYFSTDITKLMIISVFSGTLAFSFLLVFVFKYGNKALQREKKRLGSEVVAIPEMAKNPYVRMMALLFFFSVMATIFLEFSFLNVTVQKYKNENDLAAFLGVFGGATTLVSFLLQTLVADWAIKVYGPRVGLILIPTVLGLFTVLASIIGTIFGYTAEATSFILFFIFLSMSKMFLQSLREAFEDPIVKSLFIPLDFKVRFDVQSKIEGFFKEFSGFIAGGILTTLALLHFSELIYFSYLLVGVCVAYFFIVIQLFLEYRNTLTSALNQHRGDETFVDRKDYEVTDVLVKQLENKNENTVIYTLKLMEKLEPIMADNKYLSFFDKSHEKIKEHVIKRVSYNHTLQALDKLKKSAQSEKSPEIAKLATDALNNLNATDSQDISPNYTYFLTKSKKVQERIFAAHLIGRTKEDAYLPQLLLLLRDIEPSVRFAAIKSAALVKKHETWPILIEYLGSYTFTNAAAAALISYGEDILQALEAAFYKTNQSELIQEKIVQIYGRIRGEKVISLLWNKIDIPNKKIMNNVLLCLSSCGFRPKEDQISRIKQSIETDIGNSAWVIAALTELPNAHYATHLKRALEEEISFNFDNIYMLMALIYDPQSVKLVRQNIESGNVEGIVYGIELLDVFLADELKPILFPLLEDIPQDMRNEKLQNHFPRQKLDNIEVLIQIINRDYNSINKWTKACALYAYGNMKDAPMCDDLTANLFNPDELLRETAAWAIIQKNPALYHKLSHRIGEHAKRELDSLLLKTYDSTESIRSLTRIEKIFFLKNTNAFKHVKGAVLVEFVELIEEFRILKDEVILAKGASGESPLFILVHGKAYSKSDKGEIINEFFQNDLIGETLILESDIIENEIIAAEDCLLFKIEKDKFYEQINDNFEIAKELIKVVHKKFRTEKEIDEDELEEIVDKV